MSGDARKRPRHRLATADYEELRLRILERDGWRCQVCGNRQQLDIHHIFPRSRGGTDSQDNLTTLCRTCHGETHGRGPR